MEKVESLEQAAREFIEANRPEPMKCIYCGKEASTGPIAGLEICPKDGSQGHSYEFRFGETQDYEVKRLVKFAAERERQVWAEAANLADQAAGSWLSTGSFKDSDVVGPLQGLEETFRARGEQVK